MKNFGIGLALGLVGLILGVLVWFINMFGEPLVGEQMPFYDFLTTSAAVIGVGGVVVFWIILPVIGVIRHRRDGNKGMGSMLKVGWPVVPGLVALAITGLVLIAQCLPPAPEGRVPAPEPLQPTTVAPTSTLTPSPPSIPTPKPTPTLQPAPNLIIDLAYVEGSGFGYSDDADPEDEGVQISFTWYDTRSEWIFFSNVPMSVDIELYPRGFDFKTSQYTLGRCIYKGKARIDSSSSKIRIPFEEIDAIPTGKFMTGSLARVIIHTPQQGDYSIEVVVVEGFETK